jgi:tryptophan synthase alpha chain
MKLICYLSNGYPSIEESIKMAEIYTHAGADMIEIDFPSRNPYLESEFIADRMAEALKACDDYDAYMDGMKRVKRLLPSTQFILMVYENTVEEIGPNKFIDFCRSNHYEDLILVGLKDESIKNLCIRNGLKVSCYVQRRMDRMEIEYAKQSNGFVYLQAKADPDQVNPLYPTLKDCIDHLRCIGIDRPIYCGVGIHTPEDAEAAKEAGADGVFVGSTILKLHNDIPALIKEINEFKKNC